MYNNSEFILNQKGIFFKLKGHSLIQSILIDTLLTKNNCSIEDLATITHTDSKKLHQVCLGQARLSEKESIDLVTLFYMLSREI